MKLSNCLTFSGGGILTIALTRSSDGFIPSAEITCPRYVTCKLSEELPLVETQFHTILIQCKEDLLDILQVFFVRPSGDDHVVQVRSHIRNVRNQIVD